MDEEVNDIAEWLQKEAEALKMKARTHSELARREENWIYLPVRIEGKMGAFRRAERLQKLEDRWEKAHSGKGTHLMLIPAAQ